MEGFWVAVCLLGIYAAAQFAIRARPLAGTSPLDVDEGLTYPALSQAGSVFSLSALFGAYLGMYWLLGLPAIVGVAVGTLLALWFVRSVILRSGADRYDAFLCGTFLGGDASTKLVTNGLLVVTQLAYVASELLILRQLLLTGFHLAPKHATIVVTAVAVIGYYYVLRGGYVALFRADAVQALFVGLMVVSLLVSARAVPLGGVTSLFQLRHLGYWRFGGLSDAWAVPAHGLVGAVMGFSFLAASPDSWKRVFLVTRRTSRRPFLALLAASIAPFLVTLPLLLVMVPPKTGSIVLLDAFPGVRQHEGFLVMTLLGLIASTLSAFNGCSATIRFPGRVASKADVTVDPRLNRTEARLPQAFRSVLFGRAWGVPTDSEGHRLRGRSRVSSQGRVSGRAVGMWESRRGAKRSRATSTFP